MVRRVWISMPLNGSFIHFTSCPSSAAHPSVWFRHFCFRVCVPERLADKIWLDVAWSENVSKKERGCPGRRGATKLIMQGKPKEELSSLRVVGLQGHNSMSTGFWNSMGVGGEEGCLED